MRKNVLKSNFYKLQILHLDPKPDQHFECWIHADLDQATQINADPQPWSSQLASTPSLIKKKTIGLRVLDPVAEFTDPVRESQPALKWG
jgi:hypothetical protein